MANQQEQNMLLTEHFTWTPISLIDDIINTVNEIAYKATETLERGLLDHADPSALGYSERAEAENRIPDTDEDGRPVFPEAKLEIEEGVHMLETLLENTIDKNFDRLEIWTLRNVLCVPADLGGWVRLGHYKNLTIPPPNPSITPESLQLLRRKVQETQKLNVALQAEKARNDALLAQLRSLISPPPPTARKSTSSMKQEGETEAENANGHTLAFLTNGDAVREIGIQPLTTTTTTPSTQPITTHTTFILSQLPMLQQLLQKLKPHLATSSLPSSQNMGDVSDKDAFMKERKVYIESQSKRVLERRGVDTRDGVEGGIEGRRVMGDEVRGLEGLLGGMAKKGGKGGGGEGERMDVS